MKINSILKRSKLFNLYLIVLLGATTSCKDTVVEEKIVEVSTPTTQPVCPDTSEREPSPYFFGGAEELSLVDEDEQSSIKVKWNNVIGQTSSGSYHVFFITQNGLTFKKSVNAPRDHLTISGLHADTEYTILVRMMDERGRIDLNDKVLKIKTAAWPIYINEKSLAFNGVNQRINLGPSDGLLSTARFTLSAWIKTSTKHTSEGRIFTLHRAGSDSSAISVGLENDDIFFIYHDKNEVKKTQRVAYNYFDDNWHHIAMTYNGKRYALYIDGQRVIIEQDTNYGIGHHNAYLGTYKYLHSSLYKGLMDEVSVWRSALGLADVQAIYNGGVPANLKKHTRKRTLKVWYRMGDHANDDENRVFDTISKKHGELKNFSPTDYVTDTPN